MCVVDVVMPSSQHLSVALKLRLLRLQYWKQTNITFQNEENITGYQQNKEHL